MVIRECLDAELNALQRDTLQSLAYMEIIIRRDVDASIETVIRKSPFGQPVYRVLGKLYIHVVMCELRNRDYVDRILLRKERRRLAQELQAEIM
jgi:hypothetical protein